MAVFARALVPGRDVLGQARPELGAVGRIAIKLDQTVGGCHPSQEPQPGALPAARGIRLVAKVGVLHLGHDLVLHGRLTACAERLATDLLAGLIGEMRA